MTEYVYKNIIYPEFNSYLGHIFEDICIQYLLRINKKLSLPFVFETIGRWWGANPLKKQQEEIDILAVNKASALIGECKWRNEPLDIENVNALIEKSNKIFFAIKKERAQVILIKQFLHTWRKHYS